MSKLPPIPPEQRAFGKTRPDLDAGAHDHGDANAGLKAGASDDANLAQKGRQANIRQNLTPQRSVQDR